MRRSLTLLVTVVILIGLVPAAALATPPVIVDEGEFSDSFLNVPMSEECGFDVYTAAEGTYKVTVFFDKDGEPIRERIHETGKVLWSSANGEVWENYAVNIDIDYATGAVTYKGNVWNIHAGAGGIMVNDSGRIIFDGPDVIVNGPHQAFYEEFDAMCDALS